MLLPPDATCVGPLQYQVPVCNDPEIADWFLVPTTFNRTDMGRPLEEFDRVVANCLGGLAWFATKPSRHVIFLMGDDWSVPLACAKSVVFMPSCHRSSRAYPAPYFATPPIHPPRPITQCEFEVGFQGALNTESDLRGRVAQALKASARPVVCRTTDGYFHTSYSLHQQAELRKEYFQLLDNSQFIFCPRGAGVTSLRFFEALAWGRLPLLVADDAALPLADIIPYDDFVVRIPELEVDRWDEYVDRFRADHPDLELCSRTAQQVSQEWFTMASIGKLVQTSMGSGD